MRGAEVCRRVTGLTMLVVICAGVGCGRGGPERFDVSGRVTFGGRPVPAGTVVFEPDTSKGNDGAQGFAPITGGSYDTAKGGRGTVGGPHRVTVLGCDGVPVSETSPQGRPLFEPFLTTADLPRKTAGLDLAVPERRSGKPAR